MDSKTFLKFAEQFSEDFMRGILDGMNNQKKEDPTMQVTYNGFTGELVKLELPTIVKPGHGPKRYNISIYDSEKKVTHSFNGVKLEDVKFLGVAVTFGG